MLLTSSLALKLASFFLYNTLRITGIMFVIGLHAQQCRTRTTLTTLAATVIITDGAIYASTSDLAFDTTSYSLTLCANLVTAFYPTLVRPVQNKESIINIQLAYLKAVTNIPILLLTMFISKPSVRQFLLSIVTKPILFFLFLASCTLSRVTTSHKSFQHNSWKILLLLTRNNVLLPQKRSCVIWEHVFESE